MAFKVKTPKRKESVSRPKSFSLDSHNYSWEQDSTGHMKVSLGNMTDAGWYWDGDQNDLNGFIFRLNRSQVREEFLEDVKKNNISFSQIKPKLLKAVDKDDGFYEMSGDNVVWKFGNNEDVDESYEMDEEGLTDEQKNKVYEEYSPVTYEEFEKSNSKSFKEKLKKAIKESDSYEEYMQRQEEIHEDLEQDRVSENMDRFAQAINKVKEMK